MSNDIIRLGFEVDVQHADAQLFEADVLAVKLAPRSSGLDAVVRRALREQGIEIEKLKVGESCMVPAGDAAKTQHILFVGTPSIFQLDYAAIRALGQNVLAALADTDIQHLVTTVHGINTALGLDEIEAFRSLLLGMADAYQAGQYPPQLARVTITEFNKNRALLYQKALANFLPPMAEDDLLMTETGTVNRDVVRKEPGVQVAQAISLAMQQPLADDSTPHVFVAMPFSDQYDDQYYLAIQPTIRATNLLCERMDLDQFTGDITDRMFERIRSARLVVALLDGGNPNVYLEVGYAWGVGTQTVLLAQQDERLPFDVRGHRILLYDKIYRLKEMLQTELDGLLS